MTKFSSKDVSKTILTSSLTELRSRIKAGRTVQRCNSSTEPPAPSSRHVVFLRRCIACLRLWQHLRAGCRSKLYPHCVSKGISGAIGARGFARGADRQQESRD
eukprot:6193512-Pleurochrysis_carterae.AAC.1